MILDSSFLIGLLAGVATAWDEPIVTRRADEFSLTPARVSPSDREYRTGP